MLRKIIVQMIFIFALIFPYELGKADLCDICLVDECYATYLTEPDYDGDGMKDDLEIQLAQQFKPTLYLNDSKLTIRKMMDISIRNNFLTYAYGQKKRDISDTLQSTYKKSEKLKDPNEALFYAVVPGFVVHGAGHFYAGETKTGIALLATELVSFGFYVVGVLEGLGKTESGEDHSGVYVATAVVLFMGSWGFDIFRAPKIVMKQNQELQKKQGANLKLERDSHCIKLKIVKTF